MADKEPMKEKRSSPRVDNSVPVKLSQDGGDFVTETANISRSGAYCRVDKYIEPMTKLKVHLLIPVKTNNKIVTRKISCQGVVVRTEEGDDGFHVAIFFNDISQRDADCIADFVSFHLEHKAKS